MLTNITLCQWADAARTRINLFGTHQRHGEIPFTASPNDTVEYGRDLFTRAAAGEFGAVAEYVAPVPTPEQVAAEAQRADNNQARAELRADAKFQSLISKTPTQCKNWVENNFPSLTPPEQRDLSTLVMAIGILGRGM